MAAACTMLLKETKLLGRKKKIKQILKTTHAPRVIPASPLIFCGLSLNVAVKLPGYKSRAIISASQSKNRKSKNTHVILLLVKELHVLPDHSFKAQRPQLPCERRRRPAEQVVLAPDRHGREYSDDEEPRHQKKRNSSQPSKETVEDGELSPKRIAIALVAPHPGVLARKADDSLG